VSRFIEREFRTGEHVARRIPGRALGINNCEYAATYRAVCSCGATGGPFAWSHGANNWIRQHLARTERARTTLLSTPEVADRLGINRRRVLALIDSGRLPARRVGRSYAVTEADLIAYRPRPRGWPAGRPRKVKEV